MRTITIEEHFATPRFFDGPGRDLKDQAEKFNSARALKLIPQLCDLGDKRIAGRRHRHADRVTDSARR